MSGLSVVWLLSRNRTLGEESKEENRQCYSNFKINKLSTSATLFSFYFKFTDYFCEQNNYFTQLRYSYAKTRVFEISISSKFGGSSWFLFRLYITFLICWNPKFQFVLPALNVYCTITVSCANSLLLNWILNCMHFILTDEVLC